MGPFILAWLAGEAIICFRSVKMQGGPPWPGQLLAGAGAFAALAVVAEAGPGARKLALTLAWGLNAAGFLALFPQANTTVGPPGWANTITGTNPNNSGWWTIVTDPANAVSATSVLPGSGGCGGSGSGGSGSGSGGSGASTPGGQIAQGERSAQNQVYPGGCPAGQMRMPDGSCVKVLGM